ncbi:MAG: phosphatase PAP2 family protein, partial [Chloroflexota bacterium]
MFAAMAVAAAGWDKMPGDLWLTHRLQSIHSAWFARVLNETSDFAAAPLLTWMILLLAIVAGVIGGLRAGAMSALLPITRLLTPALKELIEQPRPSPLLVKVTNQPADYSFPSGHAFNAVLVYGLFFYFASAFIPQRWLRIPVQAGCGWMIVVTSLQRVYVGAHWPSNVLAGALLAGAIVCVAIVANR